MSLTDLPDLAISTILEKLDFRSILNLRNVCHDLREFIDNTIPAFWISRIGITVATDKIDLHLEDSGSNNYTIRYPEEGFETFWNNFQRLLKHQKGLLTYLNLVLHFPEDEKLKEKTILEKVYAGYLQRLQSLLKSQKHPLKVQKLCLIVGDQDEIMSILPHLDSKELEILSIFPGRGEHMQIFKLDKVVETEQWKRAKELETVNFMVDEPLEKFTHFTNCRVHIAQTISQDIIEMLKEMTSPLIQLPENVLIQIMEELDFRSLVSLRKVCHDLCNFIDDVIPSSGISEIYVRINTKKISLRFLDENIDFPDKSIQINYRNHKKGCSTSRNSSDGKKKKRVGLEDFVVFFWKDFETVMNHQKSILNKFSLVLEHYEEKMLEKKDQNLSEFSKEIMEKIKENLTSRTIPLKVKEIDFGIIDQMEMLQILPFIDSKHLEKISIGNSKGLGPQNIKIDDITKLTQWKSANEVIINYDFLISEPISNFEHFQKVEIHMKMIGADTVRVLRQTFQSSPNMNHFEIQYDPSRERQDLRTLFGHRFDGSYEDENQGARWIFKIRGDPKNVISIQTNMYSWLCLTRVQLVDIPNLRLY
ncbi:hypothetical protein B9Z55_020813 [Caenorhabditis nigoni]|uniref:F-box domain-containing protein n=1 Tax=Caenorhabditis nigoni TaxID=1611254 RepID=A0A2G5TQ37_9PELO|nr:hypothetical protein B9Z55_020813 [Caenorhabditis nigoni]